MDDIDRFDYKCKCGGEDSQESPKFFIVYYNTGFLCDKLLKKMFGQEMVRET